MTRSAYGGSFKVPEADGTALMTCWCEQPPTGVRETRRVPVWWVWEGRTWSCGKPECKEAT